MLHSINTTEQGTVAKVCEAKRNKIIGFRIPDCNCRTGCPIDLIFLWHIYIYSRVGWGRCANRYSIWPPGRHLGIRILDCNCRTDCPIDFTLLWHSGVCPIDFGRDPIFNMAPRWTSWNSYSRLILS
jgi:hypothetical protein